MPFIVDVQSKRILSIDYNGQTRQMEDDKFDWKSSGEETNIIKHIKDYYFVHAERNAVLNYRGSMKVLEGKALYVTWFPRTECTKEILQVGIKKIVYFECFPKRNILK